MSLSILALAVLAGCGKKSADEAAGKADVAAALDQVKENAAATIAVANLPQPNMKKTLSEYPEINSGLQMMLLYQVASGMPADYDKLAKAMSREYRNESDGFRRQDLLTALKPKIDAELANVKNNPYGYLAVNGNPLEAYDFKRKGFSISEFSAAGNRYFNDMNEYKVTWSNYRQLAFASVTNEALARQLEAMRTDYSNQPQLRVYFFAQSADLNNTTIKALVTAVQVTDKRGQMLLAYTPDGSVAASEPVANCEAASVDMVAADAAAGVDPGCSQ